MLEHISNAFFLYQNDNKGQSICLPICVFLMQVAFSVLANIKSGRLPFFVYLNTYFPNMKFIREMPVSSKIISVFVMLFWAIYPNWASNIAHWVSQNIWWWNLVSGIILMILSVISLAYMITFLILVVYYPIVGMKIVVMKIWKLFNK